jgi:hypothetical protein
MSTPKRMSENQKFERVYEDENYKTVWKYDYSVTRSGPVSVSITYKKPDSFYKEKKTLGDLVPQKKKRGKSK